MHKNSLCKLFDIYLKVVFDALLKMYNLKQREKFMIYKNYTFKTFWNFCNILNHNYSQVSKEYLSPLKANESKLEY